MTVTATATLAVGGEEAPELVTAWKCSSGIGNGRESFLEILRRKRRRRGLEGFSGYGVCPATPT